MHRPSPGRLRPTAISSVLIVSMLAPLGYSAEAQTNQPLFIGLGDSIGEGVQSGDASVQTQPYSYLHLLAILMQAPFPMPFIQTNLLGQVGSTSGRSRIDPTISGFNLAISGADVSDLLFTRSDAATAAQIDSETDMVLFPRQASQLEIAEALRPLLVACWIGNNDALSAVTNSSQLDGVSGLTPLLQFTADFTQIVTRLAAINARVVFATIPDVTQIAYLLDRQDLQRLIGSDHGLPAGSWTTLPTMIGLQIGIIPPSALGDPNLVLDSAEAANINLRIDAFNAVIRSTAAAHGMGVADVAVAFDMLASTPPVLFGVPLTRRFLGGLFSLDGVHPSNVTHAIVAMLFVDTFNTHYGLNMLQVPPSMMTNLFFSDPFIDKDGDGKVRGRPAATWRW